MIDTAVDPFAPPPAPEAAYGCEAAPTIRAALDRLPAADDHTKSYAERLAAANALLDNWPSDLFVAMRVQDLYRKDARRSQHWDAAFVTYNRMSDRNIADLRGARLRAAVQPERARQTLQRLIARVPYFAWARIVLLEHLQGQPAAEQFRAIRTLCPGSLAPFEFTSRFDDSDLLATAEAELARLLQARHDDTAIRMRRYLWDLRVRLHHLDSDARRTSCGWTCCR